MDCAGIARERSAGSSPDFDRTKSYGADEVLQEVVKMNYKRVGIGGIVALGITAAACGSAIGDSDNSAVDDVSPVQTTEEQVADVINAEQTL